MIQNEQKQLVVPRQFPRPAIHERNYRDVLVSDQAVGCSICMSRRLENKGMFVRV